MTKYKRFNRNGGTTEHAITGLTVGFERGLTHDDKPITKRVMKSRVRYGKTQRDRSQHAHENARNNRAQRDEYRQECKHTSSASWSPETARSKFPLSVCNGKKSRALRKAA